MNLSEMADPNCENCGGEGIVFHFTSVDDGYEKECSKCFPDGLDDGDRAYDEWKDGQAEMEFEKEKAK